VSALDRRRVARAFGIVLKTARMGAGLSQHKLAHAAHIATNFPGRMERGVQQPTLSTLIALSEALGIQPTMLVSFTVARLRREAQQ
jgi:XRE family transcriptional regulator, regulator of sulfur utilization